MWDGQRQNSIFPRGLHVLGVDAVGELDAELIPCAGGFAVEGAQRCVGGNRGFPRGLDEEAIVLEFELNLIPGAAGEGDVKAESVFMSVCPENGHLRGGWEVGFALDRSCGRVRCIHGELGLVGGEREVNLRDWDGGGAEFGGFGEGENQNAVLEACGNGLRVHAF